LEHKPENFEGQIPLRQAADEAGVQYHRLRKAASEGRLKAQKLGNQYLVLPSEVGRFLREGDGRRRNQPEPGGHEHLPLREDRP